MSGLHEGVPPLLAQAQAIETPFVLHARHYGELVKAARVAKEAHQEARTHYGRASLEAKGAWRNLKAAERAREACTAMAPSALDTAVRNAKLAYDAVTHHYASVVDATKHIVDTLRRAAKETEEYLGRFEVAAGDESAHSWYRNPIDFAMAIQREVLWAPPNTRVEALTGKAAALQTARENLRIALETLAVEVHRHQVTENE